MLGIFFSKDRREEVIEIEEYPETMVIPGTTETVNLLTQGQWMKGCPEGGEQSFLFSLYSQLSSPDCSCPQECGASISRNKSDFFALHVSWLSRLFNFWCLRSFSLSSLAMSHGYRVLYSRLARDVIPEFVWRVANRCQWITRNMLQLAMIHFSIAQIYKESYWE